MNTYQLIIFQYLEQYFYNINNYSVIEKWRMQTQNPEVDPLMNTDNPHIFIGFENIQTIDYNDESQITLDITIRVATTTATNANEEYIDFYPYINALSGKCIDDLNATLMLTQDEEDEIYDTFYVFKKTLSTSFFISNDARAYPINGTNWNAIRVDVKFGASTINFVSNIEKDEN